MYESGVAVSFLILAFHLVMIVVRANSLGARNLRKIGMRYSWSSGNPEEASAPQGQRKPILAIVKFAVYLLFTFPWILLSWLYVAYFAWTFLYSLSKDQGAPHQVKEFRWRLRNQDMTIDELINGLYAIRDPGVPLETFRNDVKSYLLDNHMT